MIPGDRHVFCALLPPAGCRRSPGGRRGVCKKMVLDIYDMRRYIQKELDGIDDYATVHELFCAVLHHHCIPYIKVRTARLRQDSLQYKMFRAKARPRSTQPVSRKNAS